MTRTEQLKAAVALLEVELEVRSSQLAQVRAELAELREQLKALHQAALAVAT